MRQSLAALLKDFPTEELVSTVAKLLQPKPKADRSMERAAFGVPSWVPDEVPKRAFAKRGIRVSKRGDKTYEPGSKTYRGRSGTWTAYMVNVVLSHRSVRDAQAGHRIAGQYTSKQLDFNWMVAQGFIQWKDD